MKKSIFLFFAAILCAMTANAQWALMGTLTDWSSGKAMTVSGTTATCTVDLAGATEYKLKVKNGGTWYGRNSTTISKTTTTSAFNTSGGDVILKTTIPGTYTFSFDTGTKKLTVTYPEVPAPHDITVRAQVPAHWTNDIYAHVWTSENATGSDVGPLTKEGDYYVVTKNAGALYVIFKNGAGWNGDTNQTVDLCYTEDVCLQINQSGSAKATATVIDCGAVAKDITIKAVVPGAWEETITAWVWPTGGDGKVVTATKNGNWYEITENCIELNAIFRNGTDWNGNANQTADITGVTENTCYQISALNKDGEGKCTYTVVDCEATIEPEAKPVDVYTVVGSDVLLGTAWDVNNADNEMTKQDDGSYVLVKENVDLATTGTYEYKVVKNHDWGWSVPQEGNLTLTGVDVDGTYNVTFTLNKELNALTTSLELVEAKKVIPECYVAGDESLTGQNWNAKSVLMTYDEATEVYTATLTAVPAGTHNMKVVYGGEWLGFDHLATPAPANVKEGDDKKIQFTLAEAGDVTVTYHATNGIGLTGNFAVPETKYYIAGTENLTGFDWKENGLQLTKDGDLYKHTFSALAAGTFEFKVTNGTWTDPWGFGNLSAAYEEVSEGTDGEGNPNGNIKFTTEEAKNITVIFDPATGKITIDGLTEKAPAADVTVYFINSGEWAEVACYYWGGLNGSAWPGVQMTANGEVFEAEGWEVYAITFPGDNTQCIFTDNKATDATQTADLKVENGKYYCYENGIWYERLADVDPLDTRVYLKGEMNEWCDAGYCDMFRKEDKSENVAYRTTWLDANTTYEFKIDDAGTWLSNEGTMDKDNCTGWEFTEGGNNAKITTEYAGDYTFVWDMTTKKLSVEYPNPMANPEVMDLMVTDMVFDGDGTFSGTDNMMGIEFALVVGSELEDGVYSLDASSTVNFGGTLFTDVTGMIAPDTETFASASAVVYGFYMGMYFQLNVEMSAGGSAGVPVEILDGTASVDDATGELIISGYWDGDDVYVVAPGFNGETYECEETWFYVGGNTWETASIIAFGPATITVDGNDVLVEGTVMSGMTGTNYDLFVIGTLPAVEEPDYTRPVASGSYGTICLPNGSDKFEGAKFYEVTYKKDGYIYAEEVTTLVAGMPYIFQATSTEIKVYYNETTAAAGSKNGVYGTFSDITDGDAGTTGNVLEGKYLLVAGPKVQKCGGNCSLAANRAYFVVSEITTNETQPLPGRKRIALGCQEENQATGLDNITENGIVAPAMQGTYDILGRQLSEPAANGFYIINGKKMFVVK